MFLIKDIKLQNFRSHSFTELKTNHPIICIIGPNGSGKTNVLEAISLIVDKKGIRGTLIEDCIKKDSKDKTIISTTISYEKKNYKVDVIFESKENKVKKYLNDNHPGLWDRLGISITGDVIDSGITSKHWLIYGSRKDRGLEAYRATKFFDNNINESELMILACSLESQSEHVLASAFNKYAKDKIALEKKIAAETKKIKQEEQLLLIYYESLSEINQKSILSPLNYFLM